MSRIIVVDDNSLMLKQLTEMLEQAGYDTEVMLREHPHGRTKEAFRPQTLEELERRHVLATIDHFGNDRLLAAKALGISKEDLTRMFGRCGFSRE